MKALAAVALTATILLGSIAACHNGRNDYRPDHGIPPCEITDDMNSFFSGLIKDNEPGAIVLVLRNDSVVYDHAFGLATIGEDDKNYISDSTLFNLSSVSKTFTSTALLKLAEEKKLSLDDKLSQYFPEFSDNKYLRDINIRHILTHSSGLPDLRPRNHAQWERYIASHKSTFGSGADYRLYGSENEYMKIFQKLDTVDFPAGTHYLRDDPAYILVAPLIERVTGSKFEDWMAQNIFEPAGMKEVFYFDPSIEHPRMAHGYRPATQNTRKNAPVSPDGKWAEFDYGETDFFQLKADRGIYTSARDFVNWSRALNNGKIISDSSRALMNTPYLHTDIPMVSFGLGNGLLIKPGYPFKSYHMNTNGGFEAIESIWPEKKLHIIIFANRSDWNERAISASMDSIFDIHGWI